MKTQNRLEKMIYNMLTENTGIALCDSGGKDGRKWQQNQKRTLKDFQNDKPVEVEINNYNDTISYDYTVNVFHYLSKVLGLDFVCTEFNKKFKKMEDWESDIYGVSTEAETWLKNQGFIIGESYNTYNYDTNISQILQFTQIVYNNQNYVLLQIHNGCDARGGYTDAKLFLLEDRYITGLVNVYGALDDKPIDNMYNGYQLTYGDIGVDDDGVTKPLPLGVPLPSLEGTEINPKEGSIIELEIMELF